MAVGVVSGAPDPLPSAEKDAGLDIETAVSIINSLQARLDAVSDLADHLNGQVDAALIREALNGYVPTVLRQAKADAWDEREAAKAQYLGPNDGHYADCMGWEDCRCASYPNPYRVTQAGGSDA